jgi:hypothetical protein
MPFETGFACEIEAQSLVSCAFSGDAATIPMVDAYKF